MEQGRSQKCRSKLPPLLVESVRQAKALARFVPEMRMRSDQPRIWLLQGPGKETTDFSGWTSPTKAGTFRPNISWVKSAPPEFFLLLSALLKALEQFPEARATVGDVFNELDLSQALEEFEHAFRDSL